MKFTKLKAVGILAGVAALAFITTPASAGTVTAPDGTGVDNDAACKINIGATPPPPSYIPSPGRPGGSLEGGDGCEGSSTYDGSTETVDLNSVTLSTNGVASGTWSNTQVSATFNVDDDVLPPAGSGTSMGPTSPTKPS